MSIHPATDPWERGSAYERYIGRWSRRIAPLFLTWLDRPAGQRWLDVGCGTGALSAAVLESCAPASVTGIEPSEGFRQLAEQQLGSRALVLPGSAESLPLDAGSCDVVVAGLVLNFVTDLPAALSEMARVAVPGGTVAGYVWDYAEGMQVIERFWDAAVALEPAAAPLHEGTRFALCRPAALQQALEAAGLDRVATTGLDLTAQFVDFDDYWQPFLGAQGPAPAYAMSLSEERRVMLRERLRHTLAATPGAPLRLQARAWAVRGTTRNEG
jgi:SAM-dependent methyltransferase